MRANELVKGKQYYYTAGRVWVTVTYKHKTKNGWLFADKDGVDGELSSRSVEFYIQEL